MTVKEMFFAALCCLSILCVYTAYKILRQGRIDVDPLTDWLIERVGVCAALIIPMTLVLGLTWYFLEVLPVMVLFGICCVYVLIVLNNFEDLQE